MYIQPQVYMKQRADITPIMIFIIDCISLSMHIEVVKICLQLQKDKRRRIDVPKKIPSLSLNKRKTGEEKDEDTTTVSFASSLEIDM